MRRLVKFLIVSIFLLILILVSFYLLSKRESSLASELAVSKAKRIISSDVIRGEIGIPHGTTLSSAKPQDINLYGRNWNFWFDLEPQGHLVISMVASRGISIVPLLNTRNSLKIGEPEYVE